jgi:nucleoside-diphosphate-sugar epimerase
VHYLVTGHTGFKGSWLILLLNQLGHEVSGLALDPQPNSLFEKAQLSNRLKFDKRCDIRNIKELIGSLEVSIVLPPPANTDAPSRSPPIINPKTMKPSPT